MLRTSSEYRINNQTILKEHIDEHYQPTEDEIREYALYIGIDPDKESELLWLAKEGLMKPLPSGWRACQDENDELYYFNFDTGKSSWEHPYDELFKKRVIHEREKRSSIIMVLDSHSKGKNTSSISDLSSGKILTNKNELVDNPNDSQYVNSDPDDELINSDAHSDNDFQKDLAGDERMKLANLAAQAAERRLSANKVLMSGNLPDEDTEVSKLRTRLEQLANEEKLELLENNRMYIDKLKTEFAAEKRREEQTLRDQMKADLKSIEDNLRENFSQERKVLETRQKNELNTLKQAIEKEKQDLQKKLREDMLSDFNLEQQSNTNIQIRLLQIKHESDEKLRNVENRYKNEIEDLTCRCEQLRIEKEVLDKRLKEKNEFCSTLQRTVDQLRGDKSSLERKLHDAEIEFKVTDDSHRQIQQSSTDDENTNLETNKTNDEDDGLSDSDSDVIELKQTLNELKNISTLSTSSIREQNPFRRTISFDRPANSSLVDSGRWSNTLLSTINQTYPLSHYQTSIPNNNFWQSQPSLITREAVLKAARDVLPPGVIDHLTSTH